MSLKSSDRPLIPQQQGRRTVAVKMLLSTTRLTRPVIRGTDQDIARPSPLYGIKCREETTGAGFGGAGEVSRSDLGLKVKGTSYYS